jgi:hypothetical protein
VSTPTLSSTSAHSAAAGLTAAEIARSTKHAAWLAAASAILAAVLALVGTFWSAHRSSTASERAAATAADAAVKAVSVQLSGETDRSRAEFLRGQRRVLYSTIIAHETEIREAERKLAKDIEDAPRPGVSVDRLWAQYANLNRDRPPAEIIASPSARAQLAALTDYQNSAKAHFKSMSLKGEVNQEWIWKYEGKRQKSFDAFCQAARKDMGSE